MRVEPTRRPFMAAAGGDGFRQSLVAGRGDREARHGRAGVPHRRRAGTGIGPDEAGPNHLSAGE